MMQIPLTGSYRWHPDRWTARSDSTEGYDRPELGQLVAWRYAVWTAIEVRPRGDADLTDEDREVMARWKPVAQDDARPYALVLRHERGPVLVEPTQTLDDGATTVHLSIKAGRDQRWQILGERYAVCACHGHPYPCQEYAAERVFEDEAARLDRLLDSHAPGVCAACREPITTRQKVITFPEPSLLVPGAPGPTYHANRGECRRGARTYELDHRLPTYPDAVRLASCPGLLILHGVGDREECTAELLCTGIHGSKANRDGLRCYTRHHINANGGGYPRPPSDCGYREHGGCLGADLASGGPDPFSVGDAFDRPYRHQL